MKLSIICAVAVLTVAASLGLMAYSFISDFPQRRELSRMKSLAEGFPANADYRHGLGVLYMRGGDIKNAEKEFLEALRLAPNHRGALESAGILYYREGDHYRAFGYWRTLLDIEPENKVFQDLIRKTAGSRSKDGAAAPDFRIVPEWIESYRLGRESFGRKEYEKAIGYFEKAALINPEDFATHFSIGAAWYELREIEKAKESWEMALKYRKEDLLTKRLITLAEGALDRRADIKGLLDKVKRAPSDREAHLALADAYGKDKKTAAKAEKAYLEALRLNPSSVDIYRKLVDLSVRLDDYGKAVKYLQGLARERPDSSDARMMLDAMVEYVRLLDKGKEAWKRNGAAFYERAVPVDRGGRTAFYIDAFEVGNARYAKFLDAARHPSPPGWDAGGIKGRENHPVVNVSWYDADAFCRWEGKRLPTEDEWVRAGWGEAAGGYPWGDAFDTGRAALSESGFFKPAPIGSYPPVNGLYDMSGNVMEWTSTGGGKKVKKGGAFVTRSAEVSRQARWESALERRDNVTGFRCVRDAQHTRGEFQGRAGS